MNNNREISICKNKMENTIHSKKRIHKGALHSNKEHKIHMTKMDANLLHHQSRHRDNPILLAPNSSEERYCRSMMEIPRYPHLHMSKQILKNPNKTAMETLQYSPQCREGDLAPRSRSSNMEKTLGNRSGMGSWMVTSRARKMNTLSRIILRVDEWIVCGGETKEPGEMSGLSVWEAKRAREDE